MLIGAMGGIGLGFSVVLPTIHGQHDRHSVIGETPEAYHDVV